MLYLGYTFEPTDYALGRLDEFWNWMMKREPWFYRGLNMVRGTSWRVERNESSIRIHHLVEFDNAASLTEYRRALAVKGIEDPAWEARRVEQDTWYTIVARTAYASPPVRMGIQRTYAPDEFMPEQGQAAAHRSAERTTA